MHPYSFLTSQWRLRRRPEVFVAMPFSGRFDIRFNEAMAPAIRDCGLAPIRVDLSKSGDSIISEIVDGISHADLVLADISLIGNVEGRPQRNSNVLYEVGLAHAIRMPSEVLLVRDDRDRLLFDVSMIPVMTMDFDDLADARRRLSDELRARRLERDSMLDRRVQMLAARLSIEELQVISKAGSKDCSQGWGIPHEDLKPLDRTPFAISRLLEKEMIEIAGVSPNGEGAYRWTRLGKVVVNLVRSQYRVTTWNKTDTDSSI